MKYSVSQARGNFERAYILFFPFSWIPHEKFDQLDRAIRAGRLMSRVLDTTIATFPTDSAVSTKAKFDKTESSLPQYRAAPRDFFIGEALGVDMPTDWYIKNLSVLKRAILDLKQAGEILEHTPEHSAIGKKMHAAGIILKTGWEIFDFFTKNDTELLRFFWHTDPVRYIIFNQNRDEIRANGGFPGSILTFTAYKWNILDFRKDDVYYYDWNLYPHKELPPPWLALLTDNYWLRDVNYYPDFRETLEKANAFVERSGEPTLTVGIALHQWFIENILPLTGPITLSGVQIPFDEKNFSLLMSTLVESKFAREKTPKDILFRFWDTLAQVIHEKRLYEPIFHALLASWKAWEFEIAARDPDMEAFLARYKKPLPWNCTEWTSITWSCPKNWMLPVYTSVSWNKSDRYIEREIITSTTATWDQCTFENKITLSHKHTYSSHDTQTLHDIMKTLNISDNTEKKKLEFIEWNGKNSSYIRIFVPKSAELAFTGADIVQTENVYARAFWFYLDTPVGGTASKTLRYKVTLSDCNPLEDRQLFVGRQPWLRSYTIIHK
jgi:hypothetical protein